MLRQNDYALFFKDDQLLTQSQEETFILPYQEIYKDLAPVQERDCFFLGQFEDKNVFAVSMNHTAVDDRFQFISARDALKVTDDALCQLICRGKQLLYWHRNSLYSGCCGSKTELSALETAKICQNCKRLIYPTTFPVVMVLITRGQQILLARSPHFAKDVYSVLAGFVDAGESCEAAVHREVAEEVGLQVKDLSYFGSQSWPFPSSLIMGYLSKYAGGEISIDKKEIEDARWFNISKLPSLPPTSSLSRHLIDSYVNQFK